MRACVCCSSRYVTRPDSGFVLMFHFTASAKARPTPRLLTILLAPLASKHTPLPSSPANGEGTPMPFVAPTYKFCCFHVLQSPRCIDDKDQVVSYSKSKV